MRTAVPLCGERGRGGKGQRACTALREAVLRMRASTFGGKRRGEAAAAAAALGAFHGSPRARTGRSVSSAAEEPGLRAA